MSVDPAIVRWLKEGVIYAPADDAGVAALWGALAGTSDVISPLATKAGADAEAARQIAFLGGPLVIDEHLVKGSRFDLLGQPVTLTFDRLGYEGGVTVFVIGAEEVDGVDHTKLTVLRKLT